MIGRELDVQRDGQRRRRLCNSEGAAAEESQEARKGNRSRRCRIGEAGGLVCDAQGLQAALASCFAALAWRAHPFSPGEPAICTMTKPAHVPGSMAPLCFLFSSSCAVVTRGDIVLFARCLLPVAMECCCCPSSSPSHKLVHAAWMDGGMCVIAHALSGVPLLHRQP